MTRENYVRKVGFADVALKLDGSPVVFVEAKRFGGIPHIDKRGDADWTLEERQAILYAASSNCKWAVLTNFEKFRVFNALTGLTILDFELVYDYVNRFGELLYLTRDFVETGRIEKLAARKERPDIDLEFLNLLNNWRILLANDIYHRNKDNDVLKDETGQLDLEKLKGAVQRILDRLIIIRWAEDNLVLEDPNILQGKYDAWKSSPTYNSIVDSLFADRAFFDKFDETHDGKIFERGHICEKVKISDDVLGSIIHEMSQRSFRKFDFDILGNTYETYLGNTLYLKEDDKLGLKPSMETRKESGIYYTPPYVVDYIVKSTLGELLKGKTPEDVAKIKVLDPACGSGSFLIKTFDYFKEYYDQENEKVRKQKEKLIREYMESSGNQLSFDVKALEYKEYQGFEQNILRNNIHGVDLDRQAAEIASVNLMLKALKPKEKLPLILDENIKVGNSLISGTEEELREYFGDDWRERHPFNWEDEFQDVFEKGGFDVVIGNPPWVSFGLRGVGKLEKELDVFVREKYPNSAEYKLSVYGFFMNRAIDLMADKAIFGFIIPDSFLLGRYFSKLRKYILDKARIVEILMIVEDFWPHGTVGRSVIILLQKEPNEALRKDNEVTVTLCDTLEDLGKKNFKRYSYKQDYFERVLYNRFRLFFEKQSKDFVDKREEGTLKLNDIVSIHTIDEIITPFLGEVAEREKLEKEIEETDKTIDQMVYELYGLTEEEIKIVEEN
ncbi:MAG TPA: N-6 DNA methylase [Methanocellales archaeon]|nr:N-6 DNA methylase [Methanocellales archaeon]